MIEYEFNKNSADNGNEDIVEAAWAYAQRVNESPDDVWGAHDAYSHALACLELVSGFGSDYARRHFDVWKTIAVACKDRAAYDAVLGCHRESRGVVEMVVKTKAGRVVSDEVRGCAGAFFEAAKLGRFERAEMAHDELGVCVVTVTLG